MKLELSKEKFPLRNIDIDIIFIATTDGEDVIKLVCGTETNRALLTVGIVNEFLKNIEAEQLTWDNSPEVEEFNYNDGNAGDVVNWLTEVNDGLEGTGYRIHWREDKPVDGDEVNYYPDDENEGCEVLRDVVRWMDGRAESINQNKSVKELLEEYYGLNDIDSSTRG